MSDPQDRYTKDTMAYENMMMAKYANERAQIMKEQAMYNYTHKGIIRRFIDWLW